MYVSNEVKVTDMMSAARERHRLVNAVLDEAATSRNPSSLPSQEVIVQFGGLDEVLLAVHHRWWTAFEAHLDELLEQPPVDSAAAVTDLWWGLGGRLGAARALLDLHAARPRLAAAEQRRRRQAGAALGLSDGVAPDPTPVADSVQSA